MSHEAANEKHQAGKPMFYRCDMHFCSPSKPSDAVLIQEKKPDKTATTHISGCGANLVWRTSPWHSHRPNQCRILQTNSLKIRTKKSTRPSRCDWGIESMLRDRKIQIIRNASVSFETFIQMSQSLDIEIAPQLSHWRYIDFANFIVILQYPLWFQYQMILQ